MTEINYWSEVFREGGQYKAFIKANSDTIHVSQGFEFESDAKRYADGYHKGYFEALSHFTNNFGKDT